MIQVRSDRGLSHATLIRRIAADIDAAMVHVEWHALVRALKSLGGRLAEVFPEASEQRRSRVAGSRGGGRIIDFELDNNTTFARQGQCAGRLWSGFSPLRIQASGGRAV